MKQRQLWLTAVVLVVLPLSAAAINVNNPPAGVFSDEWYAVMLQGHKSGHMHSTLERVKGSRGDVIRTLTEMELTAGRGQGSSVLATVRQETEETLAGEPLSFANTTKLGMIPSEKRGTIRNGKITITTSQLGQQGQAATYDLPKGAMLSWAVYREQIKRGLKPGTSYTLSLYDPEVSVDRLTPASITIGQREDIDLFGRKVQTIRSTQTISMQGLFGITKVDSVTWLDDDGDVVRLEMMPLAGIKVELLSCPKTVALAKNDPTDLMSGTLVSVKQPINAAAARKITYRLHWKTNHPGGAMPDTSMQKVESRNGGGELVVSVTRLSAVDAGKPGTLTAKEREQYMAPATMVNYKDPVVAALARRAAGDEKDPRKLADRLRRFVGDYVQVKDLNVGFASASEVARSKEGDCTEHAILLAALGRAVGIPTRVVTGIVYADNFGGRRNVFVGHMWTQFWIDGQWADLDPALRQSDPDPTHIALSVSAAGDTGIADMFSSVLLSMGNLAIDVLKTEPTARAEP